ncbi:hypothetical protein SCG7086_CX_00020 [Chlamydiales bacterium SCGC AG-110-P3]|nr:hypothetical protein SCG7086_CX_00020 [Chlamydiales bacterium SCGC AG-110-P3]
MFFCEHRYVQASNDEQRLANYLIQLPAAGAATIRQNYESLAPMPRQIRVAELVNLIYRRPVLAEKYLSSLSKDAQTRESKYLAHLLGPYRKRTPAWHMRVHELAVKGLSSNL